MNVVIMNNYTTISPCFLENLCLLQDISIVLHKLTLNVVFGSCILHFLQIHSHKLLCDCNCTVLCSGILPQGEAVMVDVDLDTPAATEHSPATVNDAKEERTTIGRL